MMNVCASCHSPRSEKPGQNNSRSNPNFFDPIFLPPGFPAGT